MYTYICIYTYIHIYIHIYIYIYTHTLVISARQARKIRQAQRDEFEGVRQALYSLTSYTLDTIIHVIVAISYTVRPIPLLALWISEGLTRA